MARKTDKKPEENWQAKAEEYLAGWQRCQADFENFRRRTEAARAELSRAALGDFIVKLAPILDDFRRAFTTVPADQADSSWIVGMRQVERHFRATLTSTGFNLIEEAGPFDPSIHEAIAYEEHPELPDGTVIDVVEVGWKIGDRVLKPARVRVSKGNGAHN